jgi:hypothetical protein
MQVFGLTQLIISVAVRVDLALGTYHIHTHYGGDSEHESSDSKTLTYTVTHCVTDLKGFCKA